MRVGSRTLETCAWYVFAFAGISSRVSGGARTLRRRVADHGREVADQEDHLVAKILQLAHLVQHHGVAEVDIRRGRIESELDPQRPAARELGGEFGLHQHLVRATFDRSELGCHIDSAHRLMLVHLFARIVD